MTNVLLLYNELVPSVRLCGYEQLKYLEKNGKLQFSHSKVINITNQQVFNADVVIMVRSDSYLELKLTEKLRSLGKYLIYVLDDDLLNVPDNLSSSYYYKRKEVKSRIRKIMSLCHCLCSPSPLILDKYGLDFNKTALIEEPAVQTSNNDHKKNCNGKIKIGFAGSIDRGIDINVLLDRAIGKILERYKDKIEIEFFGSKPNCIDKYHIKYYPYESDYAKYKHKMLDLAWDIGLAPMPDNPFHNCKHYNKYIEYSSFGIAGIYSNVAPYTRVIKNGRNGLLCNNTTEAWVDSISDLIENQKKRNKIQQNIMYDLNENFSVETVSNKFALSINEILKYKAVSYHNIPIQSLKLRGLFMKSRDYIIFHGVKFPYEILKKIGRNISYKRQI